MSESPKNLTEAVDWCLAHMSDEFKDEVRSQISKGFRSALPGLLHHGFGTYVRNELGLWSERSADLKLAIWNEIGPSRQERFNKHWAKYADKAGYTGANMFADDASSEIIDALLRRF